MSKVTGWLTKKLSSSMALGRTLLGSRPGLKIVLLLLVPVVAVLAMFSQAGCAIVVGQEIVAVASDRGDAEAIVQDYITWLEQNSELPVSINEEIKYHTAWRLQTDNRAEIRRQLAQKLDYHFGATGIYVDGNLVASVRDKVAGEQVINELLAVYSNGGIWDVDFKQNVEIKPTQVVADKLMDVEKTVEYFRFGGKGVRTYQVKNGDTLWDIASAVQLPVDELVLSNPDLQPDTLQVGQEIKISRSTPLVDVITTYTDTRQEEILYRVQEKVDDNLFLGERKVVQSGKPGQREVEYQITLENGMEINKEEFKEKIIEEPVHQVVAKGTRKLLAFRGGSGR
ncbi:MAG: G5 domain-containing protein, partial [Desulfotomaculaceae bacterium]